MTYGQFLELFLSLSLQAALLTVVTYWLGRLTRSESVLSRLWMGCFVGLLVMIFGGVLAPHPRLFHPWSAVAGAQSADFAAIETQLGRVVFAAWLIGASLVLALFAVQFACLVRFLNNCRSIDQAPESLQQAALHAIANLPEADKVVLLFGTGLNSPFCWQFRRPCIALPESLLALNPEEIRLIVRHEFEHLRTGHPLHVFLQRLVEIVFWFHPMVWWASYQASLAREFACDDAAVDSPADIAGYLRTLLKVVEQGASSSSGSSLSLDFGRGAAMIAQRARRLVQLAQGNLPSGRFRLSLPPLALLLFVAAAGSMLVWLPVDVLASPRAAWSPWPTWSAQVLHDFGVHAPDFEPYDASARPYEIREKERLSTSSANPVAATASELIDQR